MQEHRKYLVITIWISTIAFVGAGFVGWGSYQYGGAGNAVAKVDKQKIDMTTYQLAYQNLYNQYNFIFGGNLDEATAKEIGLPEVALNNLINQAHFLNLADSYGIIVSDEEVANEIVQIQSFQVDGVFDAQLYRQTLSQMRLKPSDFERIVADEIKLNKLLSLFAIKPTQLEKEVLQTVVADKIEYKVLGLDDISVSISQEQVKAYYEQNKDRYMTQREYLFEVYFTPSEGIEYTHEDIEAQYEVARFNYRDDEGKILPLDEVYDEIVNEFQMQRAKVQAQRDYIALRNNELDNLESMRLKEYEYFLEETWQEIIGAKIGDVIKPTPIDNRYVTIKVVDIIQPQVKPYEEVSELVYEQALYEFSLKELKNYAYTQLDHFSGTKTDFFTLGDLPQFEGLNEQESFEFARELFMTEHESGVFHRGEIAVIYRILDQKLVQIQTQQEGIKEMVFKNNLLARLQDEQQTRVYIK